MNFEQEWIANEDQLASEAASLGELLARMRGLLSSLPIDDREWDRLVRCGLALPPTLAGFPLWIGFPVGDSRPAACLDVSVLGGTRSAAFFEDGRPPDLAGQSSTGIAALLAETGKDDSSLQRVAGNRVMLHYEFGRDQHPGPGVFLYPAGSTLAGDPSGQHLDRFRLAFDAVTSAMGRTPDDTARRQAERAYLALEPTTRIGAIGASTDAESLRIVALGFATSQDVEAFLARAGWTGQKEAVASLLRRLEGRGALEGMQIGVQLDIGTARLASELELQIFSANTIRDNTGWFKDKDCWTSLIDGLHGEGLAIPGKLSGLAERASSVKPLFGRSGPLLLLQRIHHFTARLAGGEVERVDACMFMLLSRWPRQASIPKPGGR